MYEERGRVSGQNLPGPAVGPRAVLGTRLFVFKARPAFLRGVGQAPVLPGSARRRVAGDTGRGWGRKFCLHETFLGCFSNCHMEPGMLRGSGTAQTWSGNSQTSALPPFLKIIFLGHKLFFVCRLETVWYRGA